MLRSIIIGMMLCMVGGCTQPPESAYVGGTASPTDASKGISLGANSSGENCNQLPSGSRDRVDIFCGTWQQPAARVHANGPADTATPLAIASSGAWRDGLELRFACNAPTTTTILGGDSAAVLQCTRRIGGWPQIALVAAVNGRIYEADGILPTLALMERSIGVMAGKVSAP